MSGLKSIREFEFLGNVYAVETDDHATSVFECGDPLFPVMGTAWTDDQIKELIKLYRHALSIGENIGKESARHEIRRALGVAGI
jgi:hypothetical protein